MLPPIDLDKHIERPLLAVAPLALMAGVALLAASHPKTNRAVRGGECLSATEQAIADAAKAADIVHIAAMKSRQGSLRPSQNITLNSNSIGGFFLHVKTR